MDDKIKTKTINPVDKFFEHTLSRAKALEKEGYDSAHSFGLAVLEERITQWPSEWGDDLHILIYGDFNPPENQLIFDELSIIVEPKKLENTVIRGALCVLKAIVKINIKDINSLIDASRRINVLLGALTLVEWSHGACGWWSHLTHGSIGGARGKFENPDLENTITNILRLPPNVRQKVDAALYWIRASQPLMLSSYRNDVFRIYSDYWNAFECLVDAIDLLRPPKKLSKNDKQKMIDILIKDNNNRITPKVITEAYKTIIDSGFVSRASYALKLCFGKEGIVYINECFKQSDKHNRLYDIRNSINHGDIDAENLNEVMRVEAKIRRLWMIIWGIFGRLIPFPAPVDSKLNQNSK